MSSASHEAIRYILETHIMFSTLPDGDKRFLLTQFEMLSFQTDAEIVAQDRPMDGLYYVYSGRVRLKRVADGKRVSLGVLEKDASIGEASLIHADIWPFQALAVEPTILFRLAPGKLTALLQTSPQILEQFKREVGYITLSQRLRGMLGATRYDPHRFNALLHTFGIKSFPPGAAIFAQGQQDPRLYYLEQGEVELVRQPIHGDPIFLDRVGSGALIGEGGALKELNVEGLQPQTATALTEVTALVIPQATVQELLAINPALHDRLLVRGRHLASREAAELAVRQRAEGVDQRIRLAHGVTEEEFLALEANKADTSGFLLIKQRDSSDCAAACLAMVSNHYGKRFSLGQIVELSNLSMANPTPNAIITGAELLGYNAKGYALGFEQLSQLKLPALIGWEGYHFAVLCQVDDHSVTLADPARGIRKLKRAEFELGWTQAEVAGVVREPNRGVVIALDPTVQFEELAPPRWPILHFVRYLLPYRKYFADALIGALLLNLLGLASPLFIQTIVDTVVVHKDVKLLNMMLGGMVLVAVFRTLTTVSQSLLLAHTTTRIDMRMMSEFYRHVLSLPMSFFLTRNKGEILTRFGENAKIRAIIAGSTITVVLSTLMMFIYLLMMLGYSVPLTVVSLLFIPMYVGVTLYFTPRIKEIAQKQFLTNSRAQAYLIESLNGIESLKATANEYLARARWEEAFVDNVNMGFESQKLGLISNSLNQLINMASTVAILWIGANQVMAGSLTIGELMGFNMLVGLVMGPIQQIVQLWNSSQDVRIAIERVSDVLNVDPEQRMVVNPEAIPSTLQEVQGRIEFHQVNFSYVANGKESHVMKEFSLVIEPGQHVAFVGASGCGKSTIAKMILGFNKPQAGQCAIDGRSIHDVELTSLRRNLGVVLQDSFLFSGTVAENIALGDPEPDMAAVKEAARLAGADEFIINYPLGYQTLVGEKGMGISGGQRQRVCIARALYRRPRIMIFDEATSALDNESEARIQENMKDILAGRTSITIAHRLSTIVDSDLICFIHDGKVAEKGTHQQLIDPEYLRQQGWQGRYYRLASQQFDLPPLPL